MSRYLALLAVPVLTAGNPAVRISSPVGYYAPAASLIDLTFTFSECVTGFTAADIVVSPAPEVVPANSFQQRSPQVYVAQLRPSLADSPDYTDPSAPDGCDGSNCVRYCVRVPAGAATSVANGQGNAESTQQCFSVRKFGPLAATLSSNVPGGLPDGEFTVPFQVDFRFGNNLRNVVKTLQDTSSGFSVNQGSIIELTMFAARWDFKVEGPVNAQVCARVLANAAVDAWWSPNVASSQVCRSTGGPTDCVLSDWGPWGPCDQAPDPLTGAPRGVQYRYRSIIQEPTGGGLPCPVPLVAQQNNDGCTIPGWLSCRGEFNDCRLDDFSISDACSVDPTCNPDPNNPGSTAYIDPVFSDPASPGGIPGCTCDANCFHYGDCCEDRAGLCGDPTDPSAGTCFNRCEPSSNPDEQPRNGILPNIQNGGKPCQCDSGCSALDRDDCCADLAEACGRPESCAAKGCGFADIDSLGNPLGCSCDYSQGPQTGCAFFEDCCDDFTRVC